MPKPKIIQEEEEEKALDYPNTNPTIYTPRLPPPQKKGGKKRNSKGVILEQS